MGPPWSAVGFGCGGGEAWYGGGAPEGGARNISGRGTTKSGGGWGVCAEKITPGGTPPFGGLPDIVT